MTETEPLNLYPTCLGVVLRCGLLPVPRLRVWSLNVQMAAQKEALLCSGGTDTLTWSVDVLCHWYFFRWFYILFNYPDIYLSWQTLIHLFNALVQVIFTTAGQISMKFAKHTGGLQRILFDAFDDLLTFTIVPPSGQNFHFHQIIHKKCSNLMGGLSWSLLFTIIILLWNSICLIFPVSVFVMRSVLLCLSCTLN